LRSTPVSATSTFNKTFRAAFGLTPTQYRASRL
jgi:AraC-like DNA-binding protein